MSRWCFALFVLFAIAEAHADTRIVLVEPAPSRLPTLHAQLDLHVTGSIAIASAVADPRGVDGLVALAPGLLAEHRAALVVWVDARSDADGSQTYIVYVTGKTDRAVVELVRLPASTPANDVERIVALKLAALLDTMIATPIGELVGVEPAISSWSIGVGVSAAWHARDPTVAGGPSALLAYVRGDRHWQMGGQIAMRWHQAGELDAGIARITLRELDGIVAAIVQRQLARWTAHGALQFGAAWYFARGLHDSGRSGAARAWIPTAGLGVGIRFHATRSTAVGVVADFERLWIRQRFLADGEAVVDLGRHRAVFGLSLVTRL